MLKISQINKTYTGGVKALNDISLNIEMGVFGLLGPNGSGKSSLMRTLASLQKPDSGEILLGDNDIIESPNEARKQIGYLPQDLGVYPRVSAYEMLDYLAGLKGISAVNRSSLIPEQLERVNLLQDAHRRLDTFSGGMRRRFGIAAAFLGDPKLVIVDEPTAGLDPAERRRFQLLLADAAQRCILILSSHIVEDLAGLCTDLAILNKGSINCVGAPNNLLQELTGKVWQRELSFSELKEVQEKYHVLSWRPQQENLVVRILSDESVGDGFVKTDCDLEDLYAAKVGGQ